MSGTNQWKQGGRIFFWKYLANVRNYPGWNLVVDVAGQMSFADLLRAMLGQGDRVTRTVDVSAPTASVLAIPANSRSEFHSPAKIRITFDPSDEQAWSVTEDRSDAVLTFGRAAGEVFVDGLQDPITVFDRPFLTEPDLWFWGLLVEGPA